MSKPVILTVDDDPMVSAAITRDLSEQYGRDDRVMASTSGAEALQVLDKLACVIMRSRSSSTTSGCRR